MKSLIQLFNDWEIQLLVLLSFTLQLFLFFAGSLRRHLTNMFLRFSIWMAYLGADLVAVYALGYLSRHVGSNTAGRDTLREAQPLAFFWAPFLLIHLGGQDTITAFSMEDNNLWLRHSLNMVVQVVLAMYIFWKSIGRHNLELLISGIFVLVAGVIKYGERIWSLKCGSMESLESSTGNQYMHQLTQLVDVGAGYSKVVCTGLRSMTQVLEVFTTRSSHIGINASMRLDDDESLLMLVGFELGMFHNDLCTKAVVLRTRTGIILRCVSQIAVIVAFVTFLVSGNKHSYRGADIAITYSLFIGGFFLDLCAVFISLRSPWTWLWLKARGCNMLARFSWFLFFNCAIIGWSEKRPPWSNVVGQYNLNGWLVHSEQPRSFFNRHLMITARKSVKLFGAQEEKIFWLSQILGREYAKGYKILERAQRMIAGDDVRGPVDVYFWPPGLHDVYTDRIVYIERIIDEGTSINNRNDFGVILVTLHIATEELLSRYYGSSDVECSNVSVEVCRQLSRYMMYLLVSHPSLLPLDTSAVSTLKWWRRRADASSIIIFDEIDTFIARYHASVEGALEQFERCWIRIIIYVAAKSRPEMHAALLGRGEELLTFVWLLLAHLRRSDNMSALSWYRKMDHREFEHIQAAVPMGRI